MIHRPDEMEIPDDNVQMCGNEEHLGEEHLDDNDGDHSEEHVFQSAANFGNADAQNFVKRLSSGGTAEMIHQAIQDIVAYPEDEYLDAQFCSEALAAAEIIAAAKGCPSLDDFPQEAETWLKVNKVAVDEKLLASARSAV